VNQLDTINYPEPDARDKIHTLIINLVSPIPYASPLISQIVKSPIEKRVQEFNQLITERLNTLIQQVGDLTSEKLSCNEGLVTTIQEAYRQAETTYQEEKREALCNAVLNTALPHAPEETKQRIFMRCLDEMTVWHLRLLRLFDGSQLAGIYLDLDDKDWTMNIGVDQLSDKIEAIYPELEGQSSLYLQIISDLHAKMLIANKIPSRHMLSALYNSPQLTPLATEFLKTIESPVGITKI
jgi:hypothetical protein